MSNKTRKRMLECSAFTREVRNSKKGQFFSYDAIIGGVVFLVAVALLYSYWFGASPTMQKEARADLVRETLRLSDALLTPGSPSDWHASATDIENAKQIGLMSSLEKNELSNEKMNALITYLTADFTPNYKKLKQKLNFAYEFNATIETNRVFYNCVGKCDLLASPSPKELVEVTRVITIDNDLAQLKINAWYE
ncbi:hypothetical protein HY992_00500 [Candidatus Micrarchaeota archaeon]|nr:hypothetical protein [Candidatus Micrarchaeota archaeon]